MRKPTIHLGGSAKSHLLDAYMGASDALRTAIGKLTEAEPNGRDYYPQGDGAIGEAIREHVARLAALESVLRDIEALSEHVSRVDQWGRTLR